MDPLKFAELKRLVFTETQFGPIWDYFMDHFGENGAFLEMGRAVPEFPPRLVEVVKQVAIQALGKPPALFLTDWRLVEVPEIRFTHGSGLINGMMGSLFHFDGDDVGMFGIVRKGGETRMARFSTKLAPAPKREPSRN